MPNAPNKNIPPTIPNKIKEGCISLLLETTIGFTRLSKNAEANPNTVTPTAPKVSPEINM